MKTLNQAQMEELENFFWELYKEDLAREAEDEGRAEGEATGMMKGMAKIIRPFMSANPGYNIQEAAARLGIGGQLVKSASPAGAYPIAS